MILLIPIDKLEQFTCIFSLTYDSIKTQSLTHLFVSYYIYSISVDSRLAFRFHCERSAFTVKLRGAESSCTALQSYWERSKIHFARKHGPLQAKNEILKLLSPLCIWGSSTWNLQEAIKIWQVTCTTKTLQQIPTSILFPNCGAAFSHPQVPFMKSEWKRHGPTPCCEGVDACSATNSSYRHISATMLCQKMTTVQHYKTKDRKIYRLWTNTFQSFLINFTHDDFTTLFIGIFLLLPKSDIFVVF